VNLPSVFVFIKTYHTHTHTHTLTREYMKSRVYVMPHDDKGLYDDKEIYLTGFRHRNIYVNE